MKKIILSFITFILISSTYLFIRSFLPTSSPSGSFSSVVVKEASKKCLFKRNNCNYEMSIEEIKKQTSFEWDYLLIFPKTLGYGEYGKTFMDGKNFFQAVNIVFVKDGAPTHEEYEEVNSSAQLIGTELDLSKNQLQFERDKEIFYYCPLKSSLIVNTIDSNNIFFSSLKGCESINLGMSKNSNLIDLINQTYWIQ